MAKKPYIPLYVGDWVKDTDCISLEAEGALLRIIFKMWESEIPGSLLIRFSQIAILLKKPEEIARKIVQELHENGILDIEFIGDSSVKLESRRMIREAHISQINSENGSKGGRPVKNNKANKNQTKSEFKAKTKRNADIDTATDNDTENESVFELGKGGAGEKPKRTRKSASPKTNFEDSRYASDPEFWMSACPPEWSDAKKRHYFQRAKVWSLDNPRKKRADWLETVIGWDLDKPWQEPTSKSKETQTQTDDITRVIDEFNALTGSEYDAANEEIRGYLAGRLMDGCQLQDMLDVIALKAVQWGSGESRKYLKFHILFKPEKYPGYCQEVKDAKAGKIKVINPNESAYDRIQRKIDAALGRTQSA